MHDPEARRSRWAGWLAAMLCVACGNADAPGPPPSEEAALRAEADWVAFVESLGAEARHRAVTPRRRPLKRLGRWRERDPGIPMPSQEQQHMVDRLEAIGYVDGSRPTIARTGVVLHDRGRAQPGYSFVVSGHAAEAWLMDMDGNEIHRWSYPVEAAFPDRPAPRPARMWRRAHLFENGDVLAIYEGLALIRIDVESRLKWARLNSAHHDVAVLPDGRIYVLTRRARLVPEVDRETPILEEYISVLDANGDEKRRLSLREVFERSAEPHSWRRASRDFWSNGASRGGVRQVAGDLFHTNSIEVIDQKLDPPGFEEGHVLLSFRNLDRLAVIDLESEQAVWSMDARTSLQHDPSLTPDGRVLVFDNQWRAGERSRVALLDPLDGSVLWQYDGSDDAPLYSEECGSAALLANGNVLIVESDNGRALEVTRDGDVVWEFYNPHVAGRDGRFIATLFDLVRLPPDFPVDWAGGATVERPD